MSAVLVEIPPPPLEECALAVAYGWCPPVEELNQERVQYLEAGLDEIRKTLHVERWKYSAWAERAGSKRPSHPIYSNRVKRRLFIERYVLLRAGLGPREHVKGCKLKALCVEMDVPYTVALSLIRAARGLIRYYAPR